MAKARPPAMAIDENPIPIRARQATFSKSAPAGSGSAAIPFPSGPLQAGQSAAWISPPANHAKSPNPAEPAKQFIAELEIIEKSTLSSNLGPFPGSLRDNRILRPRTTTFKSGFFLQSTPFSPSNRVESETQQSLIDRQNRPAFPEKLGSSRMPANSEILSRKRFHR